MKAILTINNLVIPVENLAKFEELLAGGIDVQAYDYNGGDHSYYIRPAGNEALIIRLLTDEMCEAQRLVWKLKNGPK